MPIENDGSEYSFGIDNKQRSVAQGAERAPKGKPVDDRKQIDWMDLDSGSPQVGSIGELKMRFGDLLFVGSGNLVT